ncbi:MAG: hypothetical protein ACRD1U_15325 [Vicinamibacterales bacterium]
MTQEVNRCLTFVRVAASRRRSDRAETAGHKGARMRTDSSAAFRTPLDPVRVA